MLQYSYNIFGVKIISELECPELQQADKDDEHDLKVCFGKIPDTLTNPKINGVRYQRNKNEFLLYVDDVAGYHASSDKIIIDSEEMADLDSVRIFLYTSILPAVFILKNKISLSASVLEKDRDAIMILGCDGAGKSTLSAALYKKGYNIISDDITVVDFRNNNLKALPGIIFPILWENSIEHLNEGRETFRKVRPVINRYWFDKIKSNYNEDHSIKNIFFLKEDNWDKLNCKKVTDKEKLDVLLENTTNSNFLFDEQEKEMQSTICTETAGKAEMWEICRPTDINTIDETISIIEKKLKI